jgi:[ribosomal protein S18]-alanine N-acetyltransferase
MPNPNAMLLRPFRLADASAVGPWLSAPGLSLPSGRLRRQWPERLLADRRILALVAEVDDEPVGFVRIDCGPDQVAELTLAVAVAARRRGIGAAILAQCLLRARQLGLQRLVASVDLKNGPALAFFADQGFFPDTVVGQCQRLTRWVFAAEEQLPLVIEA